MSRALDRGQQPIAPSALASGTADSTTFLRGDSTWQEVPTPTIASTAEAQAGTNNTNFITPLRMREGFNASGSAPVYACRAWVNFNGTGTVSIRASGNVSSITDNGTGAYTVNLATAMPDVNYSVCASTVGMRSSGNNSTIVGSDLNSTTSTFQVRTRHVTDFANDCDRVNVAVFR